MRGLFFPCLLPPPASVSGAFHPDDTRGLLCQAASRQGSKLARCFDGGTVETVPFLDWILTIRVAKAHMNQFSKEGLLSLWCDVSIAQSQFPSLVRQRFA